MICKQCNNNVPNDSEYCQFCGSAIEKLKKETTNVSEVDKGYSYLELKRWKKAIEVFDSAIVNDNDKARSYIGKLLAKFKCMDLEELTHKRKNLAKFGDFKLAVKYADEEYKNKLKECYKLSNKKRKAKIRKEVIGISVTATFLLVVSSLTYFVFIPFGRNLYYKELLAQGKTEKAVESYTNSIWFEYENKAKELFYDSGVSFVEEKDYKNAQICFDNIRYYKDSYEYWCYSKAKYLWSHKDLEAYDYFVMCKDFLDSSKILETDEYFATINKLQGTWEKAESTIKPKKNQETYNTDYGEWDLSKFHSSNIIGNYDLALPDSMTIDGINVYRDNGYGNYKLVLIGGVINIENIKNDFDGEVILYQDAKTFEHLNYKWNKQ